MEFKIPVGKKGRWKQRYPSLPILGDIEGMSFSGYFNGCAVIVSDPSHIEYLYTHGFFGKGSLSRSFPSFDKNKSGVPPILSEQQWKRRSEWENELKSFFLPLADLELGTEEQVEMGTEEQVEMGTEEHVEMGTEEQVEMGTEEHVEMGTEEHVEMETEEDDVIIIESGEDSMKSTPEAPKVIDVVDSEDDCFIVDTDEDQTMDGIKDDSTTTDPSKDDSTITDTSKDDSTITETSKDDSTTDTSKDDSTVTETSKDDSTTDTSKDDSTTDTSKDDSTTDTSKDDSTTDTSKDDSTADINDTQYEVIVIPDEIKEPSNVESLKPRIENPTIPVVFEELHLLLEEAFLLTFALGCLNVYDMMSGEIMEACDMWKVFRSIQDDFIESYIAYHYFRAKGWVVKSGLKFGGQFLLYKDGPPYYHASYIVRIENINKPGPRPKVLWKDMIAFHRMAEASNKEVLTLFIQWPDDLSNIDNLNIIGSFKVDEAILRRWQPCKEKDVDDRVDDLKVPKANSN